MIQIETIHSHTHLKLGRREIILHEMEYSSFKDELFVLNEEKRVKINPEELSFLDFNLLYHKHSPLYSNEKLKHLDIKYLLDKYKWVSKTHY